jgi:hypothetical protein
MGVWRYLSRLGSHCNPKLPARRCGTGLAVPDLHPAIALEAVSKSDYQWNNLMRPYRFDTKFSPTASDQIEALVSTLSNRVRLLDQDIEAEEERTNCKDRRDASYSILARTFIARRDNLSVTIAELQKRRVAQEVPEWS